MTAVSRKSDSSFHRLTNAETVAIHAVRTKADTLTPSRLQLTADPDAPWSVIRIDRPGTYRLAADIIGKELTIGIIIESGHVTLDLAGFNLVGKPGSLSGIRVIGARTNVCVRNGTVRNWGGHGIDLADATESCVEHVRVTENGGDGVRLGANSAATDIHSWSNTRDGLTIGDGSAAASVTSRANAGVGILMGDSTTARNCIATGNTGHGIRAGIASVVRDCVARHNHAEGIVVGDLGSVRDCELIQNDAAAIRAGAQAIIEENRCLTSAGNDPILTGPGSTLRNNLPGSRSAA